MSLAQLTGINSPSTVFNDYKTLPETTVSRILLFAIAFSGFIFMYKIIVSGYLYLTSVGDPAKVQSATKNFINASIGLVIVLGSYLIAQIIFAVLGLETPLSTSSVGGIPGGR